MFLDYVGKCPLNHGWTQYFDEQNPTSLGDFEILTPRLVTTNQGQLCRNPTAIAARSRTTNRTYQLTGQTVHVFINRGLFCSSSQQRDRKCEDYEVRYCCPCKKVFSTLIFVTLKKYLFNFIYTINCIV